MDYVGAFVQCNLKIFIVMKGYNNFHMLLNCTRLVFSFQLLWLLIKAIILHCKLKSYE